MSGKILDCFLAALVGAISAVGTVWFLSVRDAEKDASSLGNDKTEALKKIDRLEVGSIQIDGALVVVDPTTGEPTIELRGDSIFVQKGIYADQIGAFRVVGAKIQATPGDPTDEKSPVFGELATNEDGGAYLALLSPQETHSVTIGFDKTEKGCVLSQNNEDSSMVAQAIFVKPTAQDAQAPADAPAPPVPTQPATEQAPAPPQPATEQAPAPTQPATEQAPAPTQPATEQALAPEPFADFPSFDEGEPRS